jgi:hypothetical protein
MAIAERLVNSFGSTVNKSSIYAYAATTLEWEGVNDSRVSMLIDSAKMQIKRTANLSTFQPNRLILANALAMRNHPGDIEEAYKTIKNVELKFACIGWFCRANASRGELFEASQNVLPNISDLDRLHFSMNMVIGYADRMNIEKAKPEWNDYVSSRQFDLFRPINYVNEVN